MNKITSNRTLLRDGKPVDRGDTWYNNLLACTLAYPELKRGTMIEFHGGTMGVIVGHNLALFGDSEPRAFDPSDVVMYKKLGTVTRYSIVENVLTEYAYADKMIQNGCFYIKSFDQWIKITAADGLLCRDDGSAFDAKLFVLNDPTLCKLCPPPVVQYGMQIKLDNGAYGLIIGYERADFYAVIDGHRLAEPVDLTRITHYRWPNEADWTPYAY